MTWFKPQFFLPLVAQGDRYGLFSLSPLAG